MKKKQRRISISLDEWLVIGSIATLATILIGLLPVIMSSTWFGTLIPPVEYLIYNVGFILLTIILIGAPISHAQKKKIEFWSMLRSGVSSWLVFSFILDVWQPPFSFGATGQQLFADSQSLVGTSVDYMLGWSFQQLFAPTAVYSIPIVGNVSLLFILIYFVTPIITVFLSALLFKPGILLELVGARLPSNPIEPINLTKR